MVHVFKSSLRLEVWSGSLIRAYFFWLKTLKFKKKKKTLTFWTREVKVTQSCLTLCNPMDYKVHGILQARILEWLAIPFSRGSSQPRDRTEVSHIAGGFFISWATLVNKEIRVKKRRRKATKIGSTHKERKQISSSKNYNNLNWESKCWFIDYL